MTYPVSTNPLAAASLVLGIIALAGAAIPLLNVVSLILAILAFIFALVALSKAKQIHVGQRKATVGMFLAFLTVRVFIAVSAATATAINDAVQTPAVTEVIEQPEGGPVTEDAEPEMTVSQEQAFLSAESYVSLGGFSRSGLIGQLEYEGFPTSDAGYAVDSLNVDWNEQAAQSAASYMEMGGFSATSLLDQLLYEGFTDEQAEYAVSSVGF